MSESGKSNLVGIDAAKHIKGAQKELAQMVAEGRRRAEVDGKRELTPPTVECMAFQEADGRWRLETAKDIFPDQTKPLYVKDQSVRWAIRRLREALAEGMRYRRWCDTETAWLLAAKAPIIIHAEIPYVQK